jgi:DNA-3-methyladenine glycosylase II
MPMTPQQREQADRDLCRADPIMADLVGRFGPSRLRRRSRPAFEVLAASIISQQLSNKAAGTIQRRVETLLGGALDAAALAAADHQALRAAGLSNAKARWLKTLGEQAASGTLSFRRLAHLDDEAAIRELDALPGVGRWTAEMFLIFALGRLDIFAMGDVGLRNAVNALYNDGVKLDEAATARITGRWAPWRSVASWYLWRLTDAEDSVWA